jgi:PTH1 family peptidyl-tRNA hydrolase
MDNKDLKIVVALGNPGPKYENTFHNVGVFVLEQFQDLADKKGISGLDFVVLPGFMNHSGLNLYQYLKNTNYELKNCLVIHDDSDIELGAYKISFAKSSGGQRGVQNIIDQFGSKDFWRLRIGIRSPSEVAKAGLPAVAPRAKAGDFVLKKMSQQDRKAVVDASERAFTELFN